MKSLALVFVSVSALALPAFAQKKTDQLPERTDAEILATVRLPDGYAATVFARPPQLGYPTSCSASIDGVLFVAVDENGSIGRDRNEPGKPRGYVLRLRDTDGDGRADEFKRFAEMESPRGVIWDGPSGIAPGTLYVMHPPNLTAYTDTDGDGGADRQEDILTGLGFGLDFRGADHTTNGCRLAINGFIYIAVGDYGFVNARAKDGATLTMRGGGIVRIRPDGTGFEIVSRGQRNIYDVAVSPTLDLFTRDNTNDGGGWNVRLSFVPPGAHLGYPTLFKNFSEDMLQPLADLGGGSPCGALWLDEPGLPRGLFTVEWGVGGIIHHELVPDGAGWKLATPPATDPAPDSKHKRPGVQQEKWIAMTRPTDMDVDATGALYITSWEGATFTYNGPNAGYVLRVTKKDATKVAVPKFGKTGTDELVSLLFSTSATIRLGAQREIFRRGGMTIGPLPRNLPETQSSAHTDAATFALATTFIESARIQRAPMPKDGDPGLNAIHGESVVAILSGIPQWNALAALPTAIIAKPLSDSRPRIRAAAITALRRLGVAGKMPATAGGTPTLPRTDAAPAILPLVADADPVVAHLAVRALSELQAVQVCLGALDAADEKVQPGALRALYGIYEPAVVEGLIARLGTQAHGTQASSLSGGRASSLPGLAGRMPPGRTDRMSVFHGILNALCRLANKDAEYTDPKVWWSTRPDTSGPVYEPVRWSESDKIEAALKRALDAASEDDARWLVQRMYATKVHFPGLIDLMLAKAGSDTAAKLTAIEGLFRPDNSLPAEAVAALQAASGDAEPPELRARALRLLARGADHGSVFPGAVAAFAPLAGHELPHAALTAVFEEFTRDAKNAKWIGDYAKALAGQDAPRRQLAATVLVNLATSSVGKAKDRKDAMDVVDKAWTRPESAAALLGAIARTGAKSFSTEVQARLNDPNQTVAEAALFAVQKLGLNATTTAAPQIATMKYENLFAAVQNGGDAAKGRDIYLRAACIACHTLTADEPPKGPVLSAVAKIYDRAALTESILKPSAKIAQGFESVWLKTKKGEQIEGFITREGGDSLDVRNIAGQTATLEKADVTERGHRPQSMMPEGLLNAFTPADLADLLAFLESLKK